MGLKIRQCPGGYTKSQEHYVEKILDKFGLKDAKIVASPGIPSQKLEAWGDSPLVNRTHYQEMIGSLLYLATVSRPDIAFAVTNLARYAKEPRLLHENAVKRVFKYLKGTASMGLCYRHKDVGEICGTADASWDVTEDAKSFSGYVVQLGSSLVTWKCKKQNNVALSTCEAETVALLELVKEVKWMQGFLAELNEKSCIKYPIKILSDSQAAIGTIGNSNAHYRTKHFRRAYAFVRDEVQRNNVKLEFVASENNLADMLTKCVFGSQLEISLKQLSVKQIGT